MTFATMTGDVISLLYPPSAFIKPLIMSILKTIIAADMVHRKSSSNYELWLTIKNCGRCPLHKSIKVLVVAVYDTIKIADIVHRKVHQTTNYGRL